MALTYELRFFEKLGFELVAKEALPLKVWSDCVRCPKRDGWPRKRRRPRVTGRRIAGSPLCATDSSWRQHSGSGSAEDCKSPGFAQIRRNISSP